MADIKPIETFYNGYRFRSRLEARWAVFFDKANIKYVYEPEGFILNDGTCYLPDFYLPQFHMYAEVKPEYIDEKEELAAILKLYGLYYARQHKKKNNGIIVALLKGDPANNDMSCFCHWHNDFDGTSDDDWCEFYFARGVEGKIRNKNYRFADDVITVVVSGLGCQGTFDNSAKDGKSCLINDYEVSAFYDFDEEALKARQARFEHGECGK